MSKSQERTLHGKENRNLRCNDEINTLLGESSLACSPEGFNSL